MKYIAITVAIAAAVLFGGWKLLSLRVHMSEQTVSGVVYNTKNNKFLSGTTSFSVRASENTYVSEENRSSYCLPPKSPYIELVNKAAKNKDIKVVVTTKKAFAFASSPLGCIDNVTVEIPKD